MKNKILRFITALMAVTFVVGASAVDSPNNNIPFAMCIVSLVWIGLFLLSNNDASFEKVVGK